MSTTVTASKSVEKPEEDAPYIKKEQDKDAGRLKPSIYSYNNKQFLSGPDGRLIRILCEFQEPAVRLRKERVRSTILFFGSARAMTVCEWESAFKAAEEQRANASKDGPKPDRGIFCAAEQRLKRLESTKWMCPWMLEVEKLAMMVTEYAKERKGVLDSAFSELPDYFHLADSVLDCATALPEVHDLVVTTGGGPGIMEAANKGAAKVPNAKTMGIGVILPFEAGLNPHVSEGLNFTFHYFFTRKFWMMYSCRAIVIGPGGFGTMDELFELMTLKQTGKIPKMPIVLLGRSFWKTVINWQAFADFGVVSQDEIDALCFADTAEEAYDFLTAWFEQNVMATPLFPQ